MQKTRRQRFQWRIQDFPEEGALTPKGGRQPIIWPIFSENCMKMKKFWAGGGARPSRPPLDPPLVSTFSLKGRYCHGAMIKNECFPLCRRGLLAYVYSGVFV